MERPWRFATALMLQSAGAVVFAVIGLAWWTDDPAVPLAAAAIASLLASAVAHVQSRRRREQLLQLKSRLRQMWSYGTPIAGVSLLFVMLAASDRLLIAGLIGPAAAGAYSAASSIAERAISLLLLPIALAARPQIFVEYNRGGAEASRRLLKRQSGWLMAAGLPITTLLVCAPDKLASLVVGAQLAGVAAEVLPLDRHRSVAVMFAIAAFWIGIPDRQPHQRNAFRGRSGGRSQCRRQYSSSSRVRRRGGGMVDSCRLFSRVTAHDQIWKPPSSGAGFPFRHVADGDGLRSACSLSSTGISGFTGWRRLHVGRCGTHLCGGGTRVQCCGKPGHSPALASAPQPPVKSDVWVRLQATRPSWRVQSVSADMTVSAGEKMR
jgi:hypothetical protein